MSVPFAVCFIGNSYPIPGDQFTSAGANQLVLDVVSTVKPQFWELKEVALFLTAPNVIDVNTGLGLYIKVGTGEWQYRGCVHTGHPSEAMPLVWPELPPGVTEGPPGSVLIGVSAEPVQELLGKESAKMGAREDFAKRVAFNLFRFIESFGSRSGDQIVAPSNVIDRWFLKFQDKFRRDPDFLARQEMPL